MGANIRTDIRRVKEGAIRKRYSAGIPVEIRFFLGSLSREEELEAYREHVQFLKEMGSTVISTCGNWRFAHCDPRRTPNMKQKWLDLDEAGWQSLAEGLNRAGEIAQEHG